MYQRKKTECGIFLHVADEILYSVKTDNRGSCRVVDRAEFMLMSGYGTTIQGQA